MRVFVPSSAWCHLCHSRGSRIRRGCARTFRPRQRTPSSLLGQLTIRRVRCVRFRSVRPVLLFFPPFHIFFVCFFDFFCICISPLFMFEFLNLLHPRRVARWRRLQQLPLPQAGHRGRSTKAAPARIARSGLWIIVHHPLRRHQCPTSKVNAPSPGSSS